MSNTIRLKKPADVDSVTSAVVPSEMVGDLRPGDTIEISATAEVRIGGDTNWIKFGINSKVGDGETAQEAYDRALSFQQRQFEQTVHRTVAMVRRMGE